VAVLKGGRGALWELCTGGGAELWNWLQGSKVIHNSCIHSVASHSWCQFTPLTQLCIMSSGILGPQMQMWPPHWPSQTSAARNAPDSSKTQPSAEEVKWLSRVSVCVRTEGCEFGDKATWCSSYVRGPDQCQRAEVADLCCHSCARYTAPSSTTTTSTMRSFMVWESGIQTMLKGPLSCWRRPSSKPIYFPNSDIEFKQVWT